MAASSAIHADLMNTMRPAVLALVGMVRCIASSSRCLRANGKDRTASCPPAAVVAAIKDQPFHQDAGANIVVYSKLVESGPSVKIETANRTFTIERQKLAGKIDVMPALPANITTDTELEPVRMAAKEYRNFSTRFPKSAPVLAPHITALESCIKDFEDGKARYKGEWMPKQDALVTKQNEEQSRTEEEAAIKQKVEEKRAFEESQKAKGLAKYNGKWLPSKEVEALVARDERNLNSELADLQTKDNIEKIQKEILDASSDAVLRVIGSDDDGVLCKIAFFGKVADTNYSKDSFGRTVKTQVQRTGLSQFSEEIVYVEGVGGAIDGQKVRVNVIQMKEPHRYTTVMGARATVRKYKAVGEPRPFD